MLNQSLKIKEGRREKFQNRTSKMANRICFGCSQAKNNNCKSCNIMV